MSCLGDVVSMLIDCLGIQIAYYCIITTQFSMVILSVVLIIGIYTVSRDGRACVCVGGQQVNNFVLLGKCQSCGTLDLGIFDVHVAGNCRYGKSANACCCC